MKIILTLGLLPGLAFGAAGLDKADQFFAKGEYQAALDLYSPAASTDGEEGLKALYRAAEAEGLLFRFGEAAQRLSDMKLPPDPLWQGRFLLLRSETGRQFLNQYGYSRPTDEQKDVKDVTKLTRPQWRRLIDADYNSLWDLRGELLKHRLEQQEYYVSLKGADLSYTPTVWDFAVLRWTEWLLGEAEYDGALPQAGPFAEPSYSADYSPAAPPAAKAAAIFEEASGLSSPGMDFSREYWRIERLMLPFSHEELFAAFDRTALRSRALKTLRAWAASFKSGQGRSWAYYRAAAFEEEAGDFKAAVELCTKAEQAAPGSKPAGLCSRLRAGIEMPRLELTASFAPPPGRKTLKVNVRNLPEVHFRAYRTTPEELAQGWRHDQAWSNLRHLDPETVKSFLRRKPAFEWKQRVEYPAPYQYKDQEADPPALSKGLYVVLASGDAGFEMGASILKGVLLNITDIFLLGTPGISGDPEDFLYDPAAPARAVPADAFRLYAVNALTGRPAAGADLDVFHYRSYGGKPGRSALKADADGAAAFRHEFPVTYHSGEHVTIDPLLSHGGAYAYWSNTASAGLYVPAPVSVFVETDRPVYRPGQEVKFKVTALVRQPRGYRVYDGKGKLRIAARDANWQELYSKELPFSGLGSAVGSFKIPEGRMLGQYSITANLGEFGFNFSNAAYFGVEEYKRPEFEVKLGEPAGAFRYGESAEVKGEVRYYFGSPVPGAVVKYRVVRARYLPPWCWYWGWFYGGGAETEVAAGDTRTGDDGKFSFSFKPQPESGPYAAYPSSYRVEAEARDAGGRTIADSRSYRAGAKAYVFDVKPQAGFFTPEAQAELDARLLDLNDVQQAGAAEYALYRLEKDPSAEEPSHSWGYFGRTPSLERSFSAVPDGPQAAKGRVVFRKEGKTRLALPALAPGAYRLRLKAKDPWGGESESELVLVSASADARKNAALKLPAVALFERDSYQPGETARALIGASALKGVKYTEIVADSFVLARSAGPGGLSVFSLKVGPEHRGGFGLRWLGAGGFKVYSAMGDADVPFDNKNVSLSLDYDKALYPGQRASWTLKARSRGGKPVNGEALVKIFDRSLEYYGGDAGFWGAALYPKRQYHSEALGSLFTPGTASFPVKTGLIKSMMDAFRRAAAEERLASLRIASGLVHGRGGSFFAKGLAFEDEGAYSAVAAVRGVARESMAEADMAGGAPAAMMKSKEAAGANLAAPAPASPGGGGGAEPEVKVRTDFSETAFYEPQLKVLGGEGKFSFRIPERLTSWKITSYVLTRDVRRGTVSAETVTKKDLMVRLDVPRFFREGDKSRLTAVVTNDSASELSGSVVLSVSRAGEPAHGDFSLGGLSRPFTVKAGGTEALYWDITAPRGAAAYKVRAVARAGQLSDAQENDLPVLPSRERLIASSVAALDGNSAKTFRLPELEEADPTRAVESLHLELQPQLILTVLNSLPFLVHYPYECTEQLLNRYVPLAIINGFYKKYPELRAAVAKVPKRTTITPEWERDNPVRLMSLMETPWERESKGRTSYWPVIDMLDPKTVAAEKEDAVGKLKSYQHPDGSFPWFPGGRPSLHMTLYALEGMAEASRYGVDIPQETARRALAYVLEEIPSHLKPEPGETSLILYAAYVVTSFPADWRESAAAREYAKAWADYAARHDGAMTAFGKAYAAYVYHRLGEKEKAQDYLARAMDGARSDDIAGVYWTPEKISWLWYNDTVEKHAFILRTLLALRPSDPKIPGLVRWLLFNRKGNEWKSTRASAAAIYSLLDVMKAKGALDKPELYSLEWGSVSEKMELKPFDWAGRPLRWSKYGAEIKKADLAPAVEKKGPGLAFAAFTGVYTTDKTAAESPDGMMNVSRRYFLRSRENGTYTLKPLADGDVVAVGDQVEVHLTVRTRSQFEYVHIKDPKAAGFEAETLTSGWKWDQLGRYEEPRDSLTNFFVEWLPHGEYVLKYRLRPTVPGVFKAGAAVIQSMYAPEFAAHSSGFTLNVR